MPDISSLASRLRRIDRRQLVAAAVALTLVASVLVLRSVAGPDDDVEASASRSTTTSAGSDSTSGEALDPASPATDKGRSGGGGGAGGGSGNAGAGEDSPPPGTPSPVNENLDPGSTQGIDGNEITVVYYWKGDRTRTSPYLVGTGLEANVDEAEAFRKLVAYINAHADGSATFMGFPINLHGKRLKPVVLEAGDSPEEYAALAEKIINEIKPFAAVAAHGGVSSYVCPRLAEAGIYNLSTLEVGFGLQPNTGGYCTSQGMSFGDQVEVLSSYAAARVKTTPYDGGIGNEERVFGLGYAEYPGAAEAADEIVRRFEAQGVDIAAVGAVSADLTTAQQQVGNVIAKFRDASVNTVLSPDGGFPMSFTQQAEAQGYRPDYLVWPCSGQDTGAQVRLFNPAQWERAFGLGCFDEQFRMDLVLDDSSRESEWYDQYRQMSDGSEPPVNTPLVYAGLLHLVVGINNAGPHLGDTTFAAGLDAFTPYRYNAKLGASATDANTQLGAPRSSFYRDVAVIEWSNAARWPGNPLAGAYRASDGGARHRPSDPW